MLPKAMQPSGVSLATKSIKWFTQHPNIVILGLSLRHFQPESKPEAELDRSWATFFSVLVSEVGFQKPRCWPSCPVAPFFPFCFWGKGSPLNPTNRKKGAKSTGHLSGLPVAWPFTPKIPEAGGGGGIPSRAVLVLRTSFRSMLHGRRNAILRVKEPHQVSSSHLLKNILCIGPCWV